MKDLLPSYSVLYYNRNPAKCQSRNYPGIPSCFHQHGTFISLHIPGYINDCDRCRVLGSLTPENLASLMAAYFFVKFRKFLVRNSVIYDIIRLYHLS